MLIISFLSELKINFNKFFHKKELENHPLKQKNQEDYLLGFLEAPTRFEAISNTQKPCRKERSADSLACCIQFAYILIRPTNWNWSN